MKKLSIPLLAITLATVCGASQASINPTGIYSGKFGEGKATLFIDSVRNGKVSGSSLYKHNKRPFSGTIKAQGNFWRLTLNEPATQTGDGQFDITANKNDPDLLIGTWKVFSKTNTSAGISAKSFNFKKTQCKYNKYKGHYNEASLRELDDEELFLSPDSLDYMRNEIYARHGYSFKSTAWANEFANEDWYVPCYTNVDSKLTSIEKKNIKNIKAMHKYMVANPNSWGR